MPGWFDILTLGDVLARQDEDGMLKSVNLVHRLITEEVDSGIPANRIIVGGFSQGLLSFFTVSQFRCCDSVAWGIFM